MCVLADVFSVNSLHHVLNHHKLHIWMLQLQVWHQQEGSCTLQGKIPRWPLQGRLVHLLLDQSMYHNAEVESMLSTTFIIYYSLLRTFSNVSMNMAWQYMKATTYFGYLLSCSGWLTSKHECWCVICDVWQLSMLFCCYNIASCFYYIVTVIVLKQLNEKKWQGNFITLLLS